MPTDQNPDVPHPEHLRNPEVSFEPRDLGARNILLFFAVLFISAAAIYLVVWGVYEAFGKITTENQPSPSPVFVNQPAPKGGVLQNTGDIDIQRVPEPRLQWDDVADMDKLLWQEAQLLHAKPWQDSTGAVHLSINDAMQIVAKRGLPARPVPERKFAPQVPMGQTSSGNIGLSQSEAASDATALPGVPYGYDTEPSEREKESPIPGVRPTQPHTVTGSRPGVPVYVPEQPSTPKQ